MYVIGDIDLPFLSSFQSDLLDKISNLSLMNLEYSEELKNRYPDLQALITLVEEVEVNEKSDELEELKKEVYQEVRSEYEIDVLKDVSTFRAYRDFFWDIDLDPTKTRPASEALVRRILQGKELPSINTLVDAYNLASVTTEVPLAAFDYRTLEGDLELRFAEEGEEFLGIGMDKPTVLDGGEIVVSDSEKLVAIYPYRDSEETKITGDTDAVLLMVCGVPGVNESKLSRAEETMFDYVKRFCDGVNVK